MIDNFNSQEQVVIPSTDGSITVDMHTSDYDEPAVPTMTELLDELKAEKKRSRILFSALTEWWQRCDMVTNGLESLSSKLSKPVSLGTYQLFTSASILTTLDAVINEVPTYHDYFDLEELMSATPEEVQNGWKYTNEEVAEIEEEAEKDADARRIDILYDIVKTMARRCSSVKAELDKYYRIVDNSEDGMDNTTCHILDSCDDALADTLRDAERMDKLMSADSNEVLTKWRDVSNKN